MASLFDQDAPDADSVDGRADQLDLLDSSRYVRKCGGCSRTIDRCRCSTVGIIDAPDLFSQG